MNTDFYELTHTEIKDILVRHLHNCRDALAANREQLACDTRSQSLRNNGKNLGAALTEIESLLEDFGFDADEIE